MMVLKDKKVAVIFVNPIEYHGPHLTLKNDYYISMGLFDGFRQKITEKGSSFTFQIYEIHQGSSPAPGKESIHTPLAEMRKIILKTCEKVKSEETDFVLWMTFHGAPSHAAAIESGVRYFQNKKIPTYNPFNLVMQRFRDYQPEWVRPFVNFIPDKTYGEKWINELPKDFHAGLVETSIMMALDPSKVLPIYRSLPDCPGRTISFLWKVLIGVTKVLGFKDFSNELLLGADGYYWNKMKPHLGYTGAPRLASAEFGQQLVAIFLEDYERNFWPVLAGHTQSPKPVFQWAARL